MKQKNSTSWAGAIFTPVAICAPSLKFYGMFRMRVIGAVVVVFMVDVVILFICIYVHKLDIDQHIHHVDKRRW